MLNEKLIGARYKGTERKEDMVKRTVAGKDVIKQKSLQTSVNKFKLEAKARKKSRLGRLKRNRNTDTRKDDVFTIVLKSTIPSRVLS